jgi:hypothetical protein
MIIDNTLPRTHIDQPKPINTIKRKESRSKSPLTSLTVHKNNVWSQTRSKSPSTPIIGSSMINVDETSSNASSRSVTPSSGFLFFSLTRVTEIDWTDLPSPDRGRKSVEEITQQLKSALERNPFEPQVIQKIETKQPTEKKEEKSSDLIGILVLLLSFFITYLVYLYQTKKNL